MSARVTLALLNEREESLSLTTRISYERFGTGDGEPRTGFPEPNRLKGLDRPAAPGLLALTRRDLFTGWERGDTMFT
jgi:hypothetical protein